MKRLAFIDHSFHLRTRSSDFFRELLRSQYDISYFADDAWSGGAQVDVTTVNSGNFDVVIFWQSIPSPKVLLRFTCPNLIWVPMYDSEWGRTALCWRALGSLKLKILCFSKALYEITLRFACNSFYVKYFPNTAEPVHYDSARLFFWQRTNSLNWCIVRELLAPDQVSRVVLRDDPDPQHRFIEPSTEDIARFHIEVVRELKLSASSRQDYIDLLSNCNIFVSPRLREGIGIACLEAMARGMCVVAPDLPTANEYITHGETGILFDPDRPTPLDLTRFADCGRRAREFIRVGRQSWTESIPSILRFVDQPTGEHSFGSAALVLFWDTALRARAKLLPPHS